MLESLLLDTLYSIMTDARWQSLSTLQAWPTATRCTSCWVLQGMGGSWGWSGHQGRWMGRRWGQGKLDNPHTCWSSGWRWLRSFQQGKTQRPRQGGQTVLSRGGQERSDPLRSAHPECSGHQERHHGRRGQVQVQAGGSRGAAGWGGLYLRRGVEGNGLDVSELCS